MVKYAIIFTLSRNINPIGKHLFLPFRATNVVAQFANNKHNQLQTKFGANKRKQIT
jgi:hypothetical protein